MARVFPFSDKALEPFREFSIHDDGVAVTLIDPETLVVPRPTRALVSTIAPFTRLFGLAFMTKMLIYPLQ